MPASCPPLTSSLSPNDLAITRLQELRLSDRLLQRLWRAIGSRPHFAGAIVLHALLALLLLNVAAFDASKSAQVAAQEAAERAQRFAQTRSRELRHRIERMEEIRLQFDPAAKPLPPQPADASPAALADRAQILSDAIETADRASRVADLARLAHLSSDEARRKLALDAAAQKPPPAPESAEQRVARLERRARDIVEARHARLDAQREGLRVTSALAQTQSRRADGHAKAPARPEPASGSTGQTHVADGIPRSRSEQFLSMVRLGGPQGRVGVVGTEGGLSVNREYLKGLAGGRNATEHDFGRDADNASRRASVLLEGQGGKAGRKGGVATQAPAPVTGLGAVHIPGSSLDLTGNAEDGRHDFVRYASPPRVDPGALHTAAGRVFGRGGTFAERVYLDTWYVIGPFAGKGDEAMQTAHPPEDDVDLDAAYPGPEGRTLAWRFTSRGFYPFIPPDVRNDSVYYAWSELRVDEGCDVWLSIAADDDSMMWLDGRLVWVGAPGDKPWYHPPYYLRDELVGSLALSEGRRHVHLDAGVHRLLFKLYNKDDRAFFSVVLSR